MLPMFSKIIHRHHFNFEVSSGDLNRRKLLRNTCARIARHRGSYLVIFGPLTILALFTNYSGLPKVFSSSSQSYFVSESRLRSMPIHNFSPEVSLAFVLAFVSILTRNLRPAEDADDSLLIKTKQTHDLAELALRRECDDMRRELVRP